MSWISIKNNPPPLGVEVLFCDDDAVWIGKLLSGSYLIKDGTRVGDEFVLCSRYWRPLYWTFIPRQPERQVPVNPLAHTEKQKKELLELLYRCKHLNRHKNHP